MRISNIRIVIIFSSILLFFGVYIVYLFHLQVIRGYLYASRSEETLQQSSSISAIRGHLYTREYDTPIATNVSTFSVYVDTEALPLEEEVFEQQLRKIEVILQTDISIPSAISSQPILLASNIQKASLLKLAEQKTEMPFLLWQPSIQRRYSESNLFSHITGYVGSISPGEFQILYNKGYMLDSVVGKSGVEAFYESYLQGRPGIFVNQADALGRRVGSSERILEALPGSDLVLTIDRRIQKLAQASLGERSGGVVVMRPWSGEILALVSYPSYDPNIFQIHRKEQIFRDLTLDVNSPFLNRTLQTAVAPASTFKIVMSLALLAEERFSPNSSVFCDGGIWVGNQYFRCWDEHGHGWNDLRSALANSCNVYFYTMAMEHLDVTRIGNMARSLGLGSYTGIDLGGENLGFVPSAEWKQQTLGDSWKLGDTVNMSIGQGYLEVTPLQMAMLVSYVTTKGHAVQPHILKEIRHHESGDLLEVMEPQPLPRPNVETADWEFLQSMLRGVITTGTAKPVITTDAVEVAGKTGTGQTSSTEGFTSWFVAFAPYRTLNPEEQVVVVVMVDSTNPWEWWAPKAANLIFHGIFNDMSFEETVEDIRAKGRLWYM